MKTPEEIKKGLDCCQTVVRCDGCTYKDIGNIVAECTAALCGDALAYIQQLESRLAKAEKELVFKEKALEWRYREIAGAEDMLDELQSRLAKVEREMDAAVRDLNCNWKCSICKKFTKPVDKCPHFRECGLSYRFWEWRGPCPENTKEETK